MRAATIPRIAIVFVRIFISDSFGGRGQSAPSVSTLDINRVGERHYTRDSPHERWEIAQEGAEKTPALALTLRALISNTPRSGYVSLA